MSLKELQRYAGLALTAWGVACQGTVPSGTEVPPKPVLSKNEVVEDVRDYSGEVQSAYALNSDLCKNFKYEEVFKELGIVPLWYTESSEPCLNQTSLYSIDNEYYSCKNELGLEHGPQTLMRDGNIYEYRQFESGVLEGYMVTWKSNGSFELNTMKNNKSNGMKIGWRDGGQVAFIGQMQENKRDGLWIECSSDEKLKVIGWYENDIKVNLWTRIGPRGNYSFLNYSKN